MVVQKEVLQAEYAEEKMYVLAIQSASILKISKYKKLIFHIYTIFSTS